MQRINSVIQSIPVLDWIAIGLISVLALLGFVRGARWQFKRFLCVIVAMVMARVGSILAAPVLSKLMDENKPQVGLAVSLALLFLFSLTFLSLLGRFLSPKAVPQPKSKKKDMELPSLPKYRMLGTCFGVLTGISLYFLLMACVFLLNPGPTNQELISSSKGAWASHKIILNLGPSFPLEVQRRVQPPVNEPRPK